jgi:hypothetical protein
MHFSKPALFASHVAVALALAFSSDNALANNGASGTGTSGDSAGDPGDGDGDVSEAYFISPLPNASFDVAPAVIDAEIVVYQSAIDGGIASVELFVNEASIGAQDCVDTCIFSDIELAKGVHMLRLAADNGYGYATTVYVDEELPNPNDCETGTDTGTGTDSGDTSGGGDGGGGGGCSVNTEQLPPWGILALPGLLLLAGLGRRRRASAG